MKIQFILNPNAGGGRGKRLYPLLLARIKEFNLSAGCDLSAHPQESVALALRAIERGSDLLVACGGDGTIHSLLPAVVNQPVNLGVIPIGTANDLARSWKIPSDLGRALEIIRSGQPKPVDIIETHTGTYVAGAGGLGFDAAVVGKADSFRPAWRGVAPFIVAAAVELFRYRPTDVLIRADSWEYQGPIWQILFSKIPRYALFIRIPSPSRLDDGKMAICLIPPAPRLQLLVRSPLLPFLGSRVFPRARVISASTATIESPSQLRSHGDGELLDRPPKSIRVLPRALRVMMPPDEMKFSAS